MDLNLVEVEAYLSDVQSRKPDSEYDQQVGIALKRLKIEAVALNDQGLATYIWCLETIQRCQNLFIAAFHFMRACYFVSAWHALAKIERNLQFLARHYDFGSYPSDKYRIALIACQTERLQGLFPYEWFFSPGLVVHKKLCTICEQPVSIRRPCGHVVGEIYDGEMCSRRIVDWDILETSFVKNPVNKEGVIFISGEAENYNYTHVDYVTQRLPHAFSIWDKEWVTEQVSIKRFSRVGRNNLCPCGSGVKFKRCCIKRPTIGIKALNVRFTDPMPLRLPPDEEMRVVYSKDLPTEILNLSDLDVGIAKAMSRQ